MFVENTYNSLQFCTWLIWKHFLHCTNVCYYLTIYVECYPEDTGLPPAFAINLYPIDNSIIIVLHIYEIHYVLQNNGLLIGIVIFNAIENPITFCKATEYSLTGLLCSINTGHASFWKNLTVSYSVSIRHNAWYTIVLFQQELRGTA